MVRTTMLALAAVALGIFAQATDASAHGFHHRYFGPRFGYYGFYGYGYPGYPYWDFPYSSYLYDNAPDCYKEVRVDRTRRGMRSRLATVCS